MATATQMHWISTAGNTLNSANTVNSANNCGYIAMYTLGIPGYCKLWESPLMGIFTNLLFTNLLSTANSISANTFKLPVFNACDRVL